MNETPRWPQTGLDPDPVETLMVRPPLRLLLVEIVAREDGQWRASVMRQSFQREAPRSTTLYVGGHALPDTESMIQALHTAAEELRLRWREDGCML